MRKYLFALIAVIALQSCRTQKDVLYFQNIDQVDLNVNNNNAINEYKFQPGDELMINISVENEELIKPFIINSSTTTRGGSGANSTATSLTAYTINEEGYINFPVVGKIKLLGLTRSQAIDVIAQNLKAYLRDPVVNVKLNNFRVIVLGDSGGKVVDVRDENTNLLEVLAESGDLKKTSKVEDILLVRTINGQRQKYSINLKDANLFNEPYFYVKQNDIIYVKPSRASTYSFNSTPFSAISTVLSLGLTIYALFIK